ncbi:MAG: hypothetical protein AVDCRST_MAG59-1314, partial [uncultured Thermomicrobiales bacterium]
GRDGRRAVQSVPPSLAPLAQLVCRMPTPVSRFYGKAVRSVNRV